MSEIEKLFNRAGLFGIARLSSTGEIIGCDPIPFTIEKQLELIKWLAFRDYITIVAYISGEYHSEHDKYNANGNSLECCLARLINNLWQDLTEKEKQQIKEILS